MNAGGSGQISFYWSEEVEIPKKELTIGDLKEAPALLTSAILGLYSNPFKDVKEVSLCRYWAVVKFNCVCVSVYVQEYGGQMSSSKVVLHHCSP